MHSYSISYFYKVRFMSPHQLPISTAVWDPKWFHLNRDQSYLYKDSRGVLNGLRAQFLAPDETCRDLCRGHSGCVYSPDSCEFLRRYSEQLNKLDRSAVLQHFEGFANLAKQALKLEEEPELILLVHEAPNNHCSERAVLQQWFKEGGIDLSEWERV